MSVESQKVHSVRLCVTSSLKSEPDVADLDPCGFPGSSPTFSLTDMWRSVKLGTTHRDVHSRSLARWQVLKVKADLEPGSGRWTCCIWVFGTLIFCPGLVGPSFWENTPEIRINQSINNIFHQTFIVAIYWTDRKLNKNLLFRRNISSLTTIGSEIQMYKKCTTFSP